MKILIDTGSNKNYVQPQFAKKPVKNKNPFFATSVGGNISITHHTFANVFGLENTTVKFFLLPTLKSFHAIIGNDSLKELDAVIHAKDNYMSIGNKLKIKLKQQSSQDVNLINIRTEHLNKIQKAKLQDLVNDFKTLFADPEEKLTFTTTVKGEIRTTTDRPVYSKSYPYPMCLKEQVEKQIKEYLRDGIIRQSRSPYNAPVWVVPKKLDASGEKKYRMVVDYRKLNLVTVPDKYPIPEINDVLSQLGKNKYFSTIDLKSGFHQIPLKESDVEKTAFSINNGKYEFTRLPFGLKNAPSIFQRALDDILRDHIGKRCYVYIDDIIIFSKDLEIHFNDIKIIFETLEKANLKIQLDKSEFLKTEVEFLGFIISEKGLKTNPKKTEAIMNFPEPRTLKDLRSFLGLSGYYRRFIKTTRSWQNPLQSF